MTCDRGFLHSFGVWGCLSAYEDPRGARQGRIFVPQTSHEGGTVKGSIVRGRLASTLVIPARSHARPADFHAIHCAVERHECPTLGRRAAVKPRSRAAVRQRRRA